MSNPLVFYDQDKGIVVDDRPKVTMGGEVKLNFVKDKPIPLPSEPEIEVIPPKKRAKKKVEPGTTSMVKADDSKSSEVIIETLASYDETNNMLKNTITQLDCLANEAKQDLDEIRRMRTLKGKYQNLSLITSNLSNILSTKVAAIREINSSIRISNDMDYKKLKDIKATEGQDDDKYIMDMYNAFISAPVSQNRGTFLGPNPQQATLNNAPGIVRADGGSNTLDVGYQNYLNNMTPEQNLIRYENDPNVKQCVLYDKATGQKSFQVMNVATREIIQNVPTLDNEIFMPDTTLDIRNGIARNINLNEAYPIITINEDKSFSEY